MKIVSGPPSAQAQAMLMALQDAVTKDLTKKKKWASTPILGKMAAPFKVVTTCHQWLDDAWQVPKWPWLTSCALTGYF